MMPPEPAGREGCFTRPGAPIYHWYMPMDDSGSGREVATLAGGCFWCMEAVFERVEGVEKVVSGYAGGRLPDPTYEAVCSGLTGHAEVVQVTFDPAILSYRELLELFFAFHDPTTLDRQGDDVGTQYRSAIYYHSPEQERTAREVIERLTRDGTWDDPIVTEVAPLDRFYPAEEYHQQYFQRNPTRMYCQAVVAPKVAKLRREYAARLKRAPAI
jgi:peptide-methionine (S)-S-oxide reductase